MLLTFSVLPLWPLVLFSHGLTGHRSQNTYKVEMLSNHGYLVAAVDHTDAAGFTILPGDETIIYDPARIFPSGSSNAPEVVPLAAQWTGLSLLSPLTPCLGLAGELGGAYTLRMINDVTPPFLENRGADGNGSGAPATTARYPEIQLERRP